MQKNILKSGIEISELGLGCMSLGTNFKTAQSIIDCAIEHGITYFDTAEMYDRGMNEELVGKALKKYHNRGDIIVGTKVGNRLLDNGQTTWDPSKKHIKEGVKQSLKRLKMEHIDLYQLHGGTIDDPLDETISAFDELKQEGIIRSYGISSIRPNVIDYYLKHSQIDTIMSQFNLIDNRPERLLEQIHAKQVKLLARGPVFKGLLTANSIDVLDSKFHEGIFDYTHHDLGETIASIKEIDNNLSALSFNYLVSHDALGSIIVGASSVKQLEENVHNYLIKLSLDKVKAARHRVKNIEYTQHLT